MPITSFLSLSLCFLVFFHGCFAQIEQLPWQGQQQQQQQHRLRSQSECRIENLNALKPTRRSQSEAGITEFWDENNEQFRCAGVTAVRRVIQPRGLLLPSYINTHRLTYIVQGRGVSGAVFPGCAETYQSTSQSGRDRSQGQRSRDQHQKIRNFREGDVIAIPAGVAYWAYNNGEEPLVAVTVYDTSNDANQLDQNVRRFFLAGNPQQEQQSSHHQSEQERSGRNIFSGFDEQILANAFDVETELVRNLQSSNDKRGNIVQVRDDLQVISPQSQEEEQQGGRPNGLEETLCTLRLIHNIGDPSRADVYNPRGGRITSLNSLTLPILNYLQLSAERGVLYKNAILAPQWNMNAHSLVYVTRGNGRIQIVGDSGKTVFDGQVEEGQIVIVPQNFAVVKKAGRQGFEWVAFKTNDNAMTSPLAGRLSVIRGMPEEVLMNSYDISREDARRLKYNREELTVFGPGSRSQGSVYA